MERNKNQRLLPPRTNRYGMKAKAAIVAGTMALALFPATTALAAPSDQGGMQGQEPRMEQTFGDQGSSFGGQESGQSFGGQSMDQSFGGQTMQQPTMEAPSEQQSYDFGMSTQAEETIVQAPTQTEGTTDQQQDELPPSLPENDSNQQNNQQNNQQPGQPGDQQNQNNQQPGQQNQQQSNPGDFMKTFVQKIAELLGVDLDDTKLNEFVQSLNSMMQGMQPGGQQQGQNGQQPGDQQGQNGQQPGQNGQQGQQPGMPGDQQGQQPSMPGDQQGQQPGQTGQQPGQPGGNSSAPTSYDSANTVTDDAKDASYSSTTNNQNAVLIDNKTVALDNVTVNKTGDASGEDADFYGINAAILANNGSTLTISNSNVTTDGAHANGVFSYGSGTTINISDSTINTTGNNSGGLMTTGGASLNASNLTVTTSGNSSAAIRTDRGGGTVTATQGSYSTSGVGSPAIYSTADVTVSDATLSATNSEAVVIEGGNSVTLTNANVTGSNAKLNGQSTIKTNVLIYQSMSGDASEGASNFSMTGGSLTSLTGCMFHVTNTTSTIDLSGVSLVGASDSEDLLIASADAWGTSGKNGGNVTMNLSNQTASGNITVDSVSSVALNLANSSAYTGAISNKGTVKVTLEAGSTWTLTGDSYVTSLSGDTSGINLNGHTLYVNGVAWSA